MAQNNLIPEGYVSIRDTATAQGASVGWDPTKKSVSINNQVLDPASYVNVGGRTYTRPDTITSIINQAQRFSASDPEVMSYPQNNPVVDPLEAERAKFEAEKNSWFEKMKGFQPTAPQQLQAPAPFNYNPQSDPAYQAMVPALTRSVLEQLNARGILNSSISPDSVSQAIASILPQLQEQAYGRYSDTAKMGMDVAKYNNDVTRQYGLDQYGVNKDMVSTLTDFENQQYERGITERDFKLKEAEQKSLAENRALESAWNRVSGLGYVDNQSSQILGIPVGTPSFQAREAYETRKMQNEQFQSELKLQRDKLTQDANQFYAGLKQDQSQFDVSMAQKNNVNISDEKAGLVEVIRSGKKTPNQALQEINEDVQLGFYTQAEADELKTTLGMLTQNKPKPTVTEEQKTSANLPSDKELTRQWETDPTGQSAGSGKFDWIRWAKDINNGRPSGVSFNDWMRLYGPRLTSG